MYKDIEIGDILIYNGKLEYAQNAFTKAMMKIYLSVGEYYIVKSILHGEVGDVYYGVDHGGGFWYHEKCFDIDYRYNISKKYGLR